MVGIIGAGAGRLTPGQPGELLDAGHRRHGRAIAEKILFWAGAALHGHGQIDDVRLDGTHSVVAQAEAIHHAGREIVGNHIALQDQPGHQIERTRVLHIERQTALAGIAVGEITAAIQTRHTIFVGCRKPQGIDPAMAFDFHHIGARIGENFSGVGPRTDPGEVSDADTGKRQTGHQITPRCTRDASAAASSPSAPYTAALCSPSAGAGPFMDHGVCSN